MWPQYMPFLPTLEALSGYDALLVSQFPYLGMFSGRPYLFGQNGGEIWFEAARNDEVGIITRRGIENAYAILVSNPITLAHARRYGMRNLLYVPWSLDEEIYQPGDAQAARAEWEREIGGDFFVLSSMRIDKHWKGAHHALDGFAKFAAKVPGARLVVLSWGDDLEAAKAALEERNLSDRVLALPIVGKRRLVKYLQAADVVIEQFVLGYYGGSGLEAMACGKPVIMRLERDQYDALMSRERLRRWTPRMPMESNDSWVACMETGNLRRALADGPVNGFLEHSRRCDGRMFIMCCCGQWRWGFRCRRLGRHCLRHCRTRKLTTIQIS